MTDKARRNGSAPVPESGDIDFLYHEFLTLFYELGNRPRARTLAARLEAALAASPADAQSIRGEEIRSLIAELRGDYAEAARCREVDIRKILELHTLAANTPHWPAVARQYDFADVSDRLDLLATLYDRQGDVDRAIAILMESKQYCEAHHVPFDGQDLLDELTGAKRGTAAVKSAARRGRPRRKTG
jgi:hypothetical protein